VIKFVSRKLVAISLLLGSFAVVQSERASFRVLLYPDSHPADADPDEGEENAADDAEGRGLPVFPRHEEVEGPAEPNRAKVVGDGVKCRKVNYGVPVTLNNHNLSCSEIDEACDGRHRVHEVHVKDLSRPFSKHLDSVSVQHTPVNEHGDDIKYRTDLKCHMRALKDPSARLSGDLAPDAEQDVNGGEFEGPVCKEDDEGAEREVIDRRD